MRAPTEWTPADAVSMVAAAPTLPLYMPPQRASAAVSALFIAVAIAGDSSSFQGIAAIPCMENEALGAATFGGTTTTADLSAASPILTLFSAHIRPSHRPTTSVRYHLWNTEGNNMCFPKQRFLRQQAVARRCGLRGVRRCRSDIMHKACSSNLECCFLSINQ